MRGRKEREMRDKIKTKTGRRGDRGRQEGGEEEKKERGNTEREEQKEVDGRNGEKERER